ncbi:MAG: Bax inhibitor-1/YccA family protein [Phycisphaeraceae bacterium]|nr:Bax inhibitor-1/YccA family protein [Phycisphaeraceae bacterium]
MWNSSNPALSNVDALSTLFQDGRTARSDQATLTGVVNRTGLLVLVACVSGAGGYTLVTAMPSLMWISAITAFIICLGMGFVLRGNPRLAPVIAVPYAIVEGVFLGAFTSVIDRTLASMLAGRAGMAESLTSMGVALPALVITLSVTVAMLGLYRAGIVRPTAGFKAAVGAAVIGIMIAYLLGFVLSFFGMQIPYLSLGSALEGGTAAWIGLGINAIILVVAALTLVVDFGEIDSMVESGSPKVMEWYGAFALLVSLAWIYFEAVKIIFRLALIFGRRD